MKLDLKPALPRDENHVVEKKPPENKKIFVGGLPKDLPIEEFTDYFGTYGEIVDIAIITDKRTREPRGFGFVSYKNLDSVENVMKDFSKHQFQGKWVECKMSNPKDLMDVNESEMPYKLHKSGRGPSNKEGSGYSGHTDSHHSPNMRESGSPTNISRSYNYPAYSPNMYYSQHPSNTDAYENFYSRHSPERLPNLHMEAQSGHLPGPTAIGYQPGYSYSAPTQQHVHMMSYQPQQVVYQMGGLHYQPPVITSPHPIVAHSPQLQNPEVYRNLNNQITHQPVNPKLKTQTSAGPQEINLMKEEGMMRKTFQNNRTYSNQLDCYSRPTNGPEPEYNAQGKKSLNRVSTLDLGHVGEQARFGTMQYIFQNMKSNSFHPEDRHNRSSNLSPVRTSGNVFKEPQQPALGQHLSPGVVSIGDLKQLEEISESPKAKKVSPKHSPGK